MIDREQVKEAIEGLGKEMLCNVYGVFLIQKISLKNIEPLEKLGKLYLSGKLVELMKREEIEKKIIDSYKLSGETR